MRGVRQLRYKTRPFTQNLDLIPVTKVLGYVVRFNDFRTVQKESSKLGDTLLQTDEIREKLLDKLDNFLKPFLLVRFRKPDVLSVDC